MHLIFPFTVSIKEAEYRYFRAVSLYYVVKLTTSLLSGYRDTSIQGFQHPLFISPTLYAGFLLISLRSNDYFVLFLQFHADFAQYAKIICICQKKVVPLHAVLRA